MIFKTIPLSETDPEIYLNAYVADKLKGITRKAILILPGGGYKEVCNYREGEPIAFAFLEKGYNAFVLNYSVDRKRTFPAQLIEAAMAIKHIKDHAKEYCTDPEELFVVGFSAGGHLAGSCGILWKQEEIYKTLDLPYGYNKPKGIMLIYPVIDYPYHPGSIKNLWGTDTPTEEQKKMTALQLHVDQDSSPAFILHTANDETVDVKGSLALAQAYSSVGLPFELHIYPNGPHGMALANKITECDYPEWSNPRIAQWVTMATEWADQL